ncbi:hypothetical protein VTN00DRAFT_1086 [Thermoascus crustaceus]|uniref:uncharacterized protein n=1 Tax=Thermoascus crustaceus TaxID=5088 RepID=UPI00374356D5
MWGGSQAEGGRSLKGTCDAITSRSLDLLCNPGDLWFFLFRAPSTESLLLLSVAARSISNFFNSSSLILDKVLEPAKMRAKWRKKRVRRLKRKRRKTRARSTRLTAPQQVNFSPTPSQLLHVEARAERRTRQLMFTTTTPRLLS